MDGSEKMRLTNGGYVGINATNPGAYLDVRGASGGGDTFKITDSGNAANYRAIYLNNNDSTLAFNNGSNVANLSSAGAWTNASDIRIKKNVADLSKYSLDTVLAMRPVQYDLKSDDEAQIGFIAQEMQQVVPEVVVDNGVPDHMLGISYGNLGAIFAKAIQEIATITGTFKSNLIAWLADAQNGIDKIFTHELIATNVYADHGNFRELTASTTNSNIGNFQTANAQKLCLGSRCMTAEQFNHLLDMEAAAAASQSSPPPPANDNGSPSSLPGQSPQATLTINGNNPATWSLNQAWHDNLGALFTHDGQSETVYSTSTVDVATVGTTTLDYWAVIPSTQQVLHATRDVVIQGGANDNTSAATSDASTTPPAANDNQQDDVGTSTATSTGT